MTSLMACRRAGWFLLLACMTLISPPGAQASEPQKTENNKLPLVYSDGYDISILGIEYLHSFDTHKYSKVFKRLIRQGGLKKDQFYSPGVVSDEQLLTVHTPEYLESLKQSGTIAKIAGLRLLKVLPNPFLQKTVLDPMRKASQGTLLAGELALEYGWAINLSGGYHHAKPDRGGGFCFFADIPILAKQLQTQHKIRKALVVDLDAHQGNGIEAYIAGDDTLVMFDMYNVFAYPGDEEVKRHIKHHYPVRPGVTDKEYLAVLQEHLPLVVELESPDLIIYNAGTDIYEKDPLGGLHITEAGILQRDMFVFQTARRNKIPIVMLLSGGYTGESSKIIGKSIQEILKIMNNSLHHRHPPW